MRGTLRPERVKGKNMKTQRFQIGTIPAVLYGEPAKQGYVFLHGQMGRKEEAEAFAQVVCPKGLQVLSMELPLPPTRPFLRLQQKLLR